MNQFDPRIYLFTAGHFATDWAQSAIPALLPYFIATCHLSYQDAGTLIFANILLSSLCQPIFGYYADRVSKPWFAPLGPVISGLSIAILPFTTNYWVIFACCMFSGLGSSIFHPEAARMVNGLAGDHKGKALGTFSVGGNAGFAVGPALAGFCAYVFDIHGLVLFGIVNVTVALLLHSKLPAIQTDIRQNRIEEVQSHPHLALTNDWSSFGRLAITIFARSTGFATCNAFIPLYWIYVLGASASSGSLALTILFTLGAFVTYFGGILSDRIGFVRILRLAFMLMIPAMLLLVNSPTVPIATAALIPAAFALFAPYSAIVVLGQSYLGKNIGFASGVTLGLSTTIGGVLSPFIGRAADLWGIQTALQILWIVPIFAAIAAFTLRTPPVLVQKKK